MVQILPIEDLDSPELKPYLTLKSQEAHRGQGLFVAEGEKVVDRLLETPWKVRSLLVTPEWAQKFVPKLEGRPEEVKLYIAPKKSMEGMTGYPLYQGVLACAEIPQTLPLLQQIQQAQTPRFWIALEGLSNPENIGVILRNSAALGAQGVLLSETCASPFLRRSVRSSMGGIFKIAVHHSANFVEDLALLQKEGIQLLAAHPSPQSGTIHQGELEGDLCIILGSEGPGLTKEVLTLCPKHRHIPMARDVDSLNVASAAAVFLYEVCRQRAIPSPQMYNVQI